MVDEPIPVTKVVTVQPAEMVRLGPMGKMLGKQDKAEVMAGMAVVVETGKQVETVKMPPVSVETEEMEDMEPRGTAFTVAMVATATLGTAQTMEQTVNEARTDQIYTSPLNQSILPLSG